MKLIVTRHGEANHNLGIQTFAAKNTGLAPEGVKTAKKLAQKIGKADKIFCSPLKRSSETAQIISQILDNHPPIFEIDEIQEVDVGKLVGGTADEAKERYPKAAEAFYHGHIAEWNFPGGENFEQVSARVDKAVEKIEELADPHDTVLIVGHGMLNRVMFYKYLPKRKDLWGPSIYPHDRVAEIKV